jgi:hypothetical protein
MRSSSIWVAVFRRGHISTAPDTCLDAGCSGNSDTMGTEANRGRDPKLSCNRLSRRAFAQGTVPCNFRTAIICRGGRLASGLSGIGRLRREEQAECPRCAPRVALPAKSHSDPTQTSSGGGSRGSWLAMIDDVLVSPSPATRRGTATAHLARVGRLVVRRQIPELTTY